MMPGMDGPATLEALRQLPRGAVTPVVFMTARVQAQEVSRYRALGAVEVIGKPFDPMSLAETVREIWSTLPCSLPTSLDGDVEELRRYFAGRLPERLAEIAAARAAAGTPAGRTSPCAISTASPTPSPGRGPPSASPPSPSTPARWSAC